MLFGNSIRSRVLEVIDARIQAAEASYRSGVTTLKDDFKANLSKLKDDLVADTEALANSIVNDVLGPLA